MKDYMEIKLNNGQSVKVDTERSDYLNQWKWSIDTNGYAKRSTKSGAILMHQVIMGTKDKSEIDHINQDKLDNRISNLCFVTRTQNNLNRPIDPRSKTGHNGITLCKTGSYRVRLSMKELGRYKTIDEAIKVRDNAVSKEFLNCETNPSKPPEMQ